MSKAKEFGKLARNCGINAPTLDENLSRWLVKTNTEKNIDHYVQWWEGWYEALDESLSFANVSFTKMQPSRSYSKFNAH